VVTLGETAHATPVCAPAPEQRRSIRMPLTLAIGDSFPDLALPDSTGALVHLSHLTRPSLLDIRLGFHDGYPLIVQFFRGFFCPRDQQHMRQYVQFQQELAVNYAKLVAISADPPLVNAAFRAGLGATWAFLSDERREVITPLGILDETEGEYAYRAQPYTFVLRPDLSIHAIYDGWWFVGRPTLDELRHDLRAIMQARADYHYEAYDTLAVRSIRIPQQEWASGVPPLGASGLPVAEGVVRWFDGVAGVGMITAAGATAATQVEVFFSFTAIPGQGYRTLRAGTAVRFELVESPTGSSARNIQPVEAHGD
jgi:peroxiredoxin/cold shock CspA family protein